MAQSSNDPSGMYLRLRFITDFNNSFLIASAVHSTDCLPPDDDGYLPLLELLHGDLQGVSLTLELHHDGGAPRI